MARVPAWVAADLVVVQAALLLRRLEACFDGPLAAGDMDQLIQGGTGWAVGDVVRDLLGPADTATGNNPVSAVLRCQGRTSTRAQSKTRSPWAPFPHEWRFHFCRGRSPERDLVRDRTAHLLGDDDLGLEADRVVDTGLAAPLSVVRPGGGQIQRRSISVQPPPAAQARKTPTWQFSVRPAVPEYCRCIPAERVPFFRKPVSSTMRGPRGRRGSRRQGRAHRRSRASGPWRRGSTNAPTSSTAPSPSSPSGFGSGRSPQRCRP